jgi:probable HAF family extracellular repeat protein
LTKLKQLSLIPAFAAFFLNVPTALAATLGIYSLTDLGNLGATAGGPFFPRYINENNQVVGVGPTGTPGQYAAYSSVNGAGMSNIGGLGGNSVAFALNNSGSAVGQSENGPVTTATRWIAGVPSAVSGLSGPNNSAGGINNSGQIAGWMDAPSGGAVAYRLTGGTLENFGNLGGLVSDIDGMNSSGRFVGNSETATGGFNSFRAFVSSTSSNTLLDLGLLSPTHNSSLAFGINDAGAVIGTSNFFQASPFVFTTQGFVWQNGVMREIPSPLSYEILSPSGINNSGIVVGRTSPNAFSRADEAWLFDGVELHLLTSHLESSLTGWKITNAWEINDSGFIAAEALDPNGIVRNVLLSPVPEPGSALLAFLVATTLGLRRRR